MDKKNKKPHIKNLKKEIDKINVNKSFSGKEGLGEVNEYINQINKNNKTDLPVIRDTHVDQKDLFEPVGILDPKALRDNPLTGSAYSDVYYNATKNVGKTNPTYKSLAEVWSNFPMYSKREEAIKKIYENQVVLIVSGTGSGKTVLTPKFALHALNYQGRIAITNPKRLPSEENAIFAAKTLDVPLGSSVGLKYRNSDPKYYNLRDNKLIFCTDGYILARLQSDPLLPDFDAVIIDEAHERGVQIDLLLLLLKELIKKRPTFKLIIMSATVNEKIFINYFPEKEFKFGFVDAGEVPNFPIKEYFLDKPVNQFDQNGNIINNAFIEAAVDRAVNILRNSTEGDILVFFSGKGELQEGCTLLHRKIEQVNKELDKKIYCNILHAGTDNETKDLLKNAQKYKEINNGRYERKVIMATEVAESSITINGLDYVIDSGLVNENVYYSEKNMLSLEKKYISKASHKQRKGRVGRTREGICYNLFTKLEYEKKFPDYGKAPILIDDISPQLMYFLSKDYLVSHIDFPFQYKNSKSDNNLAQFLLKLIEPPPEDNIKRALDRIVSLGAITRTKDRGEFNDMGRAMAVFDTIPEVGKMLISGYNYHCRDEMVNLAAMFEIGEFRMETFFERFSTKAKDEKEKKRQKEKYEKIKKKWASSLGDHFSLLHIYEAFYERRYDTIDRKTGRIIKEKKGDAREYCKENYFNYKNLDRVKHTAKDINRKFGKVIEIFREKNPNSKPTHLFLSSPPNISDKKEENIIRALMEGFYINLIRKVDRKYMNCYPPEKTTANLTQDSLYAVIKSQTNYAFYTQLKSIFGRGGYGMVSKVPTGIVADLKKIRQLESCFKAIPKTTHKKQKFRTGRRGY